ncbi:MAG: bifunctional hydroxymethylpyrimidine kinase/phosphomethylpyrimidine kinase [Mycobacteriaceae bacterium]
MTADRACLPDQPPRPELLPLPAPGETPRRVLTVAGSDSGGGAGMQADLRTMALLGVHGCAALTAVTVQNTVGVSGVHEVPAETVAAQVRAVTADIGVGAVKTGMLASTAIITALAAVFREVGIGTDVPLVLDPVAASVGGDPLFSGSAQDTLRDVLFPMATLLTPNLDEVRLFTGINVVDDATQREAARVLHGMGPRWVLVKGGHLREQPESTDVLYDGATFTELSAPRTPTTNDHGAGDCLGAAVACALAHGWDMGAAVGLGKAWATRCVAASYPLGAGHGPVSPLWRLHP